MQENLKEEAPKCLSDSVSFLTWDRVSHSLWGDLCFPGNGAMRCNDHNQEDGMM